ncbi:MAG: outer membrane beta-barrel domain-containing protein [Proteobacteria bacterium]|nr:outer membrane beta-barrel domain-containing protein [Pseudomonadota bacterium]
MHARGVRFLPKTALVVALVLAPPLGVHPLGLQPGLAAAAEGGGPLAGQPAVRLRRELRDDRFEIGPSLAFALNRSYRHAVMLGAKLEYHLTDAFSLGGEVAYGVSFDTGLTDELKASYAGQSASWGELHSGLSDLRLAADLRAVFTPISGKLSLFSALFLHYDCYLFAGFGMGILANGTDDPGVDAANEGFQPGAAWGLGVRVFANDYVAIGLELKDLFFADNESGGDTTRGLSAAEKQRNGVPVVDGDDQSLQHHFFFGLNATFFLPRHAVVSR